MQNHPPAIAPSAFSGLELLSSAVVLIDEQLAVRYLNPGAENLFATSSRKIVGQPLRRLLGEPVGLESALDRVLRDNWSYTGHRRHGLVAGQGGAALSGGPAVGVGDMTGLVDTLEDVRPRDRGAGQGGQQQQKS